MDEHLKPPFAEPPFRLSRHFGALFVREFVARTIISGQHSLCRRATLIIFLHASAGASPEPPKL